MTAFISYKEFTESLTAPVDGFDIVTHFDKVAGLNFDGLKFLVVLGYPKVKHEVVIEHARKQYASDSNPLPQADPTLTDDNSKPISEYIQLTEDATVSENGYEITERRYTDPRLEKVRKQLATEKLEQAIGRARHPVWKDTTTLIITNAPVSSITERAILFSDAALNLAETASQIPTAMDRIKEAEETGDVKAVMETKDVGKSQAYELTKAARKQKDSDRDAKVLELHQQGKSLRKIHAEIGKSLGISYGTIAEVIKAYRNSDHQLSSTNWPSEKLYTPTNADDTYIESETLHISEPDAQTCDTSPPIPPTFYSSLDLDTAKQELKRCQERNNYNGAAFLRSHIKKQERQLTATKKGATMNYYNILTVPPHELFTKMRQINAIANDNTSPEQETAIDALNNLSSLLEKRFGSRADVMIAPGHLLTFGEMPDRDTLPPN